MDRSFGRVRGRSGALLTLCLLLAACGRQPPEPPKAAPVGVVRIASGDARAFSASADGAWVAWLDGCHVARGQYLPPGTANCVLSVAPSKGGEAGRVAGAVTTLPQGSSWSPTGATLVALADYDYAAGSGTLVLWRGGTATELGRGVTFHGFGKNGELGFVSGGKLSVLLPGEAVPREVAGAEGIASFDFSPAACPAELALDGPEVRLSARRTLAAGGQLLVADCTLKAARPLVKRRVFDYGFSSTGSILVYTLEAKGGPELHRVEHFRGIIDVKVGTGAANYSVAPDGQTIAFIGDATPGKQGNLYLVEPGHPAERAAKDVGEFRWAAKAPRVAWLEKFDPRVRSGVVGAGGPGLKPHSFGRNVTDFDISSDGKHVAFLQHTARGGYSVDLGLATLDGKPGAAPASVAQGVFGFSFAPDAKWLYYRTRCVRNGEGCDLERVPAGGLPKGGKAELLAEGMKSFEFDPRDPSRLLIGWQRKDRAALDIAIWQGGKLVRIDETVLPGSARFLGPGSRRVGYAVIDPKRAGVYVVEIP